MNIVQFLGIEFRSVEHLFWFKLSSATFLAYFVFFAARLIIKKFRKNFIFSVYVSIVSVLFCICHFEVSIKAYSFTKGGQINGNLFSADCIWFNGLLAIVYGLFCVLALNDGIKRRVGYKLR